LKNLIVFSLLSLASPLVAQEATEEVVEKFSIHGYLTQAWAKSDGEQILGISKQGTTDYRRAAVLLRFSPTPKDSLVIQLAHRRLGLSPVSSQEPDVKLDWAFYSRDLGANTSLRVGRLPQPLGIHNETRYVGTLLPFYRAPYNFYQEGSFTSETIDGAMIGHAISPDSSWNAEVSAYGGGFTMFETTAQGPRPTRAEKGIGAQVWLNTPLSGLRFGVGAMRMELAQSASGKDRWNNLSASAEYAGERVKVRSEYRRTRTTAVESEFDNYYVYGGVNVTPRLVLHAQFDTCTLSFLAAPGFRLDVDKFYRDQTLGASFAARPDVVIKAEYHWTKSQLIETNPAAITGPARPANYFIASMSVSF
jgi:hypothetical protein